jgi:hypothetical protein
MANSARTVLVSASLCVGLCCQMLFTELYVCIDPAVSVLRLNETSRNLTIVVPLLFVYLFMVYLTTLLVSQTASVV